MVIKRGLKKKKIKNEIVKKNTKSDKIIDRTQRGNSPGVYVFV